MHSNVLIHRLRMLVDQRNLNSKPSLVIISAGTSVHTLREIHAVHVAATDSLVTLLTDVKEVRLISSLFNPLSLKRLLLTLFLLYLSAVLSSSGASNSALLQ